VRGDTQAVLKFFIDTESMLKRETNFEDVSVMIINPAFDRRLREAMHLRALRSCLLQEVDPLTAAWVLHLNAAPSSVVPGTAV
jgi:hypothetical protein